MCVGVWDVWLVWDVCGMCVGYGMCVGVWYVWLLRHLGAEGHLSAKQAAL